MSVFAMRLRRAGIEDVAALQAVFQASIEGLCQRDYSAAQRAVWAACGVPREPWEERVRDGYFLLAVSAAGDCMGFASLEGAAHLHSLYVHPTFARRGVGRVLVEAHIAEARARGARRLHTEASLTARPFFERLRFRMLSQQIVPLGGEELVNFCMQLDLA